jgi:hypothetical protein
VLLLPGTDVDGDSGAEVGVEGGGSVVVVVVSVSSGDVGSGRDAACARTSSCSWSEAGAVPTEKSGGDDDAVARVGAPPAAAGGVQCGLTLGGSPAPPAPARTNRSTSDGRAFNRGRSPTCIQSRQFQDAARAPVTTALCNMRDVRTSVFFFERLLVVVVVLAPSQASSQV